MRHHYELGVGIGLASIGSLWGAALCAALPTTVLDTTPVDNSRPAISGVIPQGWSFFTRDPQLASLVIYTIDPGERIARAGTLPQARPENLGGLSRNQRSQDTEKALIASSITEWSECDGRKLEECAAEALRLPAEVVVLDATNPHFCGEHLLVLQAVVPFAFRHATSAEIQVEQMVLVDIACEGGS